MIELNENVILLYNKWKEGYVRKETEFEVMREWVESNFTNKLYNHDEFEYYKNGITYNHHSKSKFEADIHCLVIRDRYLVDGKLPYQFISVSNSFKFKYCSSLTSLENSPIDVGGNFYCMYCDNLKSLEGAPKNIEYSFECTNNHALESIEGIPEEINNFCNFYNCYSLKTLDGAPKIISKELNLSGCDNIESFDGLSNTTIKGNLILPKKFIGVKLPKGLSIEGKVYHRDNYEGIGIIS